MRKFVTIEVRGPVCSGKTTLVGVIADALRKAGIGHFSVEDVDNYPDPMVHLQEKRVDAVKAKLERGDIELKIRVVQTQRLP